MEIDLLLVGIVSIWIAGLILTIIVLVCDRNKRL